MRFVLYVFASLVFINKKLKQSNFEKTGFCKRFFWFGRRIKQNKSSFCIILSV